MKTITLPAHNNRRVKLIHRDLMRHRSRNHSSHNGASVPVTTLPVDGTNNAGLSFPMDGNDTYGDCGEAMACHSDNIYTYRQGKGTESQFSLHALEQQYLSVSGGDNGLSESMVVDDIWKRGIAGVPQAVIQDSLDFDITNTKLAQYLLDQFYIVCMGWSVPDDFLQRFAPGSTWTTPGIPDASNGHFTPLADCDTNGNYRLITWGAWCWAGPKFVASVDPQSFAVFSSRQFDANTGLDSKGRHVSAQASIWTSIGGNAQAAQSVVSMFPPLHGPVPPKPKPPIHHPHHHHSART